MSAKTACQERMRNVSEMAGTQERGSASPFMVGAEESLQVKHLSLVFKDGPGLKRAFQAMEAVGAKERGGLCQSAWCPALHRVCLGHSPTP